MKILIVEDERAYRTLLFDYLNANHEVSVVCDGVSAIALLSAPGDSYDLVILDVRMPGLEGDLLLDSFAHWNSCKTSFVVISGAMDPARFKSIPAVAGCLAKPFSLRQLDEFLRPITRADRVAAAV